MTNKTGRGLAAKIFKAGEFMFNILYVSVYILIILITTFFEVLFKTICKR